MQVSLVIVMVAVVVVMVDEGGCCLKNSFNIIELFSAVAFEFDAEKLSKFAVPAAADDDDDVIKEKNDPRRLVKYQHSSSDKQIESKFILSTNKTFVQIKHPDRSELWLFDRLSKKGVSITKRKKPSIENLSLRLASLPAYSSSERASRIIADGIFTLF